MPKTCNNCGTEKTPATVPYVVHESAMARAERQSKRLVAVIILLILLLVGSNIGWLVYESQFQTVETVEEYQIEQDGENAYRPQSDKMYKLRIYSNEKRMETTGFYIGSSSL